MKESTPVVPAYVERRENCPRYTFAGGVWIVLADTAQTAGNITNIESIYQHGGGLPRLFHERTAEMAYVISGRLRVRIGDEAETAGAAGDCGRRRLRGAGSAEVAGTRHGVRSSGSRGLSVQRRPGGGEGACRRRGR